MIEERASPVTEIPDAEREKISPDFHGEEVEVLIDERSSSVEFLLAEFQEMNEEYRRTKDEGLNRLNFFITLTSSVLAGLIALNEFSAISNESWQYVSLGALTFLLIIGWSVHQFTIKRGISTDMNIRAMARVRRYFVDQDPTILPYLIWQAHDEPSRWLANNTSNIRRTTQAIVAMTFALFVGLIFNLTVARWLITIGAGVVGFFIGFLLLRFYANRQYKQASDEAKRDMRFPQNS